ncbi:MAG: hypothetical protein ABSE43_13080 [Steroidobacteraceae bacterium]
MSDLPATEVPDSRAPCKPTPQLDRPTRLAWLLFIVASWMLLHLYEGIRHDAIMYSMQGLAHVHPKYWANDVFLRFGSQDQFSLFAPLYARFIGWFGLEPAAELLTAIAEVAFFVAAWRLARLLLPERQALISVFLLVALPGTYGSVEIFHVVEDFITPRLLSEALLLVAILGWLTQRRVLAMLFMTGALLVHPLMAASGVALCLWLSVVHPKPRLALLLALIALGGLALIGLTPRAPPLRFDDYWFQISPTALSYLLIHLWDAYVWGLTLPPLILLAAGSALLEAQPARRVAQAALGIGVAGIALTAYGADLLHITLIVQAQPWRSMWLSVAIAIMLMPLIVPQLWRHNNYGRATVMVLLSQCLLVGEHYAAPLALLSLLLLWLALRAGSRHGERQQRLALYGAALVLALALTVLVSEQLMALRVSYFPHAHYAAPVWAKRLRELTHSGLAAFLALGAFLWATWPRRKPWNARLVLALCAASCCAMVPMTYEAWTQITYDSADKQLFASWREKIPPNAEVLFPENPLFTWILLERPSYMSGPQATSGLFSRPAAMFMFGRAEALRLYLRSINYSVWDPDPRGPVPPQPTLALACQVGDLQFVVSRTALEATPIAEVSPSAKSAYRGLKLYRCPNIPN